MLARFPRFLLLSIPEAVYRNAYNQRSVGHFSSNLMKNSWDTSLLNRKRRGRAREIFTLLRNLKLRASACTTFANRNILLLNGISEASKSQSIVRASGDISNLGIKSDKV